jgi:Domain of unknown function (DUF6924)
MSPSSDCSLLVRTDFTSEQDWQQVSTEAQAQYQDGFQAYIAPVSDSAFEGASWQVVKAASQRLRRLGAVHRRHRDLHLPRPSGTGR